MRTNGQSLPRGKLLNIANPIRDGPSQTPALTRRTLLIEKAVQRNVPRGIESEVAFPFPNSLISATWPQIRCVSLDKPALAKGRRNAQHEIGRDGHASPVRNLSSLS